MAQKRPGGDLFNDGAKKSNIIPFSSTPNEIVTVLDHNLSRLQNTLIEHNTHTTVNPFLLDAVNQLNESLSLTHERGSVFESLKERMN